MLLRALTKLGLLCDSGVLDQIREEDMVEILDEDLCQIYRSYNCYDLCNYSLEELTSHPFYELYERHSKITQQLVEACGLILNGQKLFHGFDDMPEYHIKELLTERPEFFAVREKFLAPLSCTINRKTYILSVKRMRALGIMADEVGSRVRYL
ncbi:MAG: hypothetical protein EOP11_16705 [Proteobacteria bacterium]|nr:MAG: hypothetical protein EOP11_16705 [Pseudomonadota bacterium]